MTSTTKIKLLKQLDLIFGGLAVALLPRPKKVQEGKLGKVLFIRPGGIGDAVLLIPVLNRLKAAFPDVQIDVLAEKRNAATFRMCEAVDNVFLYDSGRGILSVLRSAYDVIIDTEQWHRLTAVVSRLVKTRIRVGYGVNERRRLYTDVIDYSHEQYEIESFNNLLQPLGVDTSPELSVPFLVIPDSEIEDARSKLQDLVDKPYIVLFPGASIPERKWGVDRFHHLARELNCKDYPVVVIGGHEDRRVGDQIISGVKGGNLAGQLSLLGSAAVISNSILLVSGDSGILHIGVGMGKPTVSLFGSGIAAKWAPKGERHVVLNKGLPCSPCTRFGTTPPCPIGVKCLTEISVDEVFAAIMKLLGSNNH